MAKIRFILLAFSLLYLTEGLCQTNIIVMQTETPIGMQTYFYSGNGKSLQTDEIKKKWDENYYITSAAYTSVGWFVAMSKGVRWTSQSYNTSNTWPDAWIHEQKGDSKYITTLASSDNNWFVVTSKNCDILDQQVCAAPWNNLKEWIAKWWNSDYYITNVACQNGLWTVVMSKTTIYTNQSYFWATSTDELKKKIQDKWDKGYDITCLEYGNGEYFVIMSVLNQSKKCLQQWQTKPADISKHIKEYWDKSYRIVYIGG